MSQISKHQKIMGVRNSTPGIVIKDNDKHIWQYTAEFSLMNTEVEKYVNKQFRDFLKTLTTEEHVESALHTMKITLPAANIPNAFREEMSDGWFRVMIQWPLHEVDVEEDFANYFMTNVCKYGTDVQTWNQ